MTSWAEKWKMEFNLKKCKVMHFGTNIKNVSMSWGVRFWRRPRRRGTSV
jgi:hypothetical protein